MEYGRWISAYKRHYSSIIPILILREPRELSTRRGSLYFKYLSEENQTNNITSEWYNNILTSLEEAKESLEQENIDKLQELQVFTFSTNTNGLIEGFKRIEL